MSITAQAFQQAALSLGCDIACIRAVDEVESAGAGFDERGRVKILFEPHIFAKYSGHKFDKSHPHLSYGNWKPGAPSYSRDQHAVLAEAKALDPKAAIMSASWGRYQLMGFNFEACGFRNVYDFEAAMNNGEGAQLGAFVKFILKDKVMLIALRAKDWRAFAERYNGPGFAKNKYDTKLAVAYAKHGGK